LQKELAGPVGGEWYMDDEKNTKILEVDTSKARRHVSRRLTASSNYHHHSSCSMMTSDQSSWMSSCSTMTSDYGERLHTKHHKEHCEYNRNRQL
jgi:hypothetical protein